MKQLPVHLARRAYNDIEAARAWYESQQEGLGQKFLDQIDVVIANVGERPTSFPVVRRQMRRAMMHRFPYGAFFIIEPDRIVVLAVIDLRRHPRTWLELAP